MTTLRLPTERFADASTAHLSPEDRALLARYIETEGADGLPCLAGPYGWLVSASAELRAAEHASPVNCPGFCGDSKTREVRDSHEQ